MKLPIKNRKRRRLLVGSVIIFLIAIFLALPLIDRLGGPSEKREDQLDPFRIKFVMPERIVQLVNVQPGDTILDIGAGYGLFTFLLADASGNSGKVFATDIDQKIIDYLLNQAGEKHIDNVKPVLVSPKPDDPFYPQHTYDIIFCSDVWWGIDDPYSFFKNLSKSLKPGSGRLWIISWRLHPDFTIEEFGDFSAMLGALRFQENASLVWDRLSPDVRKALTDKKNNSVSPSLQKLFVDELNRILTDPTLYPEALRSFADETIISNSNKIRVAKHLAHDLEKAGVFTSEKHVINSRSLKCSGD